MKTREQWLEEKRKCIGASDVAPILGFDPHRTAHDVWLQKVMGYDYSDNRQMWFGREVEDIVARWYETERGVKIFDHGSTYIQYHDEYPWLGVTLDRYQAKESLRSAGDMMQWFDDGPVEIKTASGSQAGRWGENRVPIENEIQLQTQIEVCGNDHGTAVALLWGNQLVWRDIGHDKAFMNATIPILESFWFDHVVARVPPPVTSPMCLGAVKKINANDNGDTIELDEAQQHKILCWSEAKSGLKEYEKCVDELDAEIRQMVGEFTFAKLPNGSILESKKVVCKNGKSYRKLKLKGGK